MTLSVPLICGYGSGSAGRSWTCRAVRSLGTGSSHLSLGYRLPSGGVLWRTVLGNNNNNRIQRRSSRFVTISSQRREPSPTRTLKWPGRNRVQITRNTSSAYHVRHVVLRATWYEGTAQLLSLAELKSHSFELYFIGCTINR